jgi:hypothetical protein
MAQNLISMELTEAQITEAQAALAQLERVFAALISLSADDRKRINKMGQKSEVFCRQTLSVLTSNLQIVPPRLDLAEATRDLRALDQLRPLSDRLEQLFERCRDTEMALGADVMEVALEGYAILRVSGKEQGLDSLRKEIGSRWVRGKRGEGAPAPA